VKQGGGRRNRNRVGNEWHVNVCKPRFPIYSRPGADPGLCKYRFYHIVPHSCRAAVRIFCAWLPVSFAACHTFTRGRALAFAIYERGFSAILCPIPLRPYQAYARPTDRGDIANRASRSRIGVTISAPPRRPVGKPLTLSAVSHQQGLGFRCRWRPNQPFHPMTSRFSFSG
jgi:hypothetical protein